MRYEVTIPAWGDKPRRAHVCVLAASIAVGRVPMPGEVLRYYGPDAPKSAFKSSSVARIVFEVEGDPGNYIIVPEVPRAMRHVRELPE